MFCSGNKKQIYVYILAFSFLRGPQNDSASHSTWNLTLSHSEVLLWHCSIYDPFSLWFMPFGSSFKIFFYRFFILMHFLLIIFSFCMWIFSSFSTYSAHGIKPFFQYDFISLISGKFSYIFEYIFFVMFIMN